MTVFNAPDDIHSRIRQSAKFHRINGYDHFGPNLGGWRREREIAEISARDAASQGSRGMARFLTGRWFG